MWPPSLFLMLYRIAEEWSGRAVLSDIALGSRHSLTVLCAGSSVFGWSGITEDLGDER